MNISIKGKKPVAQLTLSILRGGGLCGVRVYLLIRGIFGYRRVRFGFRFIFCELFRSEVESVESGQQQKFRLRSTMEEINNRNMTEEERQALAAKLDADLDNFINSLEKKRYTDGWTPETWEKVSHILFMPELISLSFAQF